jgi:hypothetical protein
MTDFLPNDKVEILTDRFIDEGVRPGSFGYILEQWHDGCVEVEVVNRDGSTAAQFVAQRSEIRLAPSAELRSVEDIYLDRIEKCMNELAAGIHAEFPNIVGGLGSFASSAFCRYYISASFMHNTNQEFADIDFTFDWSSSASIEGREVVQFVVQLGTGYEIDRLGPLDVPDEVADRELLLDEFARQVCSVCAANKETVLEILRTSQS